MLCTPYIWMRSNLILRSNVTFQRENVPVVERPLQVRDLDWHGDRRQEALPPRRLQRDVLLSGRQIGIDWSIDKTGLLPTMGENYSDFNYWDALWYIKSFIHSSSSHSFPVGDFGVGAWRGERGKGDVVARLPSRTDIVVAPWRINAMYIIFTYWFYFKNNLSQFPGNHPSLWRVREEIHDRDRRLQFAATLIHRAPVTRVLRFVIFVLFLPSAS